MTNEKIPPIDLIDILKGNYSNDNGTTQRVIKRTVHPMVSPDSQLISFVEIETVEVIEKYGIEASKSWATTYITTPDRTLEVIPKKLFEEINTIDRNGHVKTKLPPLVPIKLTKDRDLYTLTVINDDNWNNRNLPFSWDKDRTANWTINSRVDGQEVNEEACEKTFIIDPTTWKINFLSESTPKIYSELENKFLAVHKDFSKVETVQDYNYPCVVNHKDSNYIYDTQARITMEFNFKQGFRLAANNPTRFRLFRYQQQTSKKLRYMDENFDYDYQIFEVFPTEGKTRLLFREQYRGYKQYSLKVNPNRNELEIWGSKIIWDYIIKLN